ALDMVAMPMVMKGGTLVLMGAFDPAAVLDLVERHRVTVMFGVPSMFNAMAQAPGFADADLSSLRRLLCGGAPVPLSTIRTYLDRGIVFLQGYGMTETAPGALFLGAERAAEKRSEEHTSELQSRENLVCRLLLEKKKHSSGDAAQTSIVA